MDWPAQANSGFFGRAKPSRGGVSSFLMVSGGVAGPSDEAIGTHEHGAQTQPILRVACDIRDPIPPASCKRCERRGSVKVQQQAFPVPEEFADCEGLFL
jgi:hypothetical protein